MGGRTVADVLAERLKRWGGDPIDLDPGLLELRFAAADPEPVEQQAADEDDVVDAEPVVLQMTREAGVEVVDGEITEP